jgi:hypothetical protein
MEDRNDQAKTPEVVANQCKTTELFQFLKGVDMIMLVVGSIAALIAGLAMPAFVFFFGKLTDSFNPDKGGADTLGLFSLFLFFQFISDTFIVITLFYRSNHRFIQDILDNRITRLGIFVHFLYFLEHHSREGGI